MRKIILILIIVSLLFLFKTGVFAQETTQLGTATPSAKVEYTLPYPGILPDSPIYFLKALRDRVIGFLIRDPLKKAEFNLLAADKRLSAGILLLNKGKEELALSTISKGENYFEFALREVEAAKNKGQDTKPILERVKPSALKHQEILKEMKEKIGGGLKVRTEKELQRVSFFLERVNSLKNLQKD